jgi:bifunctional enzyme CysN/CysC
MPWYAGPSLWAVLRSFSLPEKRLNTQLRMPLQDIYRFSKGGDTRRIYCGTITAGTLKKGDRILFSPSQKTGIVASIESEPIEPTAGCATGFTLEQPLFVERGELISHQESFSPLVGNRLKVRLFWIGSRPISEGAKYHFRIHTHKVGCTIEAILAVYDSATLAIRKEGPAQAYEIIECIIRTVKPVAFDIPPLFLDTTRFALVDALEMVAAGVVQENQGPPAS